MWAAPSSSRGGGGRATGGSSGASYRRYSCTVSDSPVSPGNKYLRKISTRSRQTQRSTQTDTPVEQMTPRSLTLNVRAQTRRDERNPTFILNLNAWREMRFAFGGYFFFLCNKKKSQNCVKSLTAFVCTNCKQQVLYALLQLPSFVLYCISLRYYN